MLSAARRRPATDRSSLSSPLGGKSALLPARDRAEGGASCPPGTGKWPLAARFALGAGSWGAEEASLGGWGGGCRNEDAARGTPATLRLTDQRAERGARLLSAWLRSERAGWPLSAVLKGRPRRGGGPRAAGQHTPNPGTALLLPGLARQWQPALHRDGLRAQRREGGGGGSCKRPHSLTAGPTSIPGSLSLG